MNVFYLIFIFILISSTVSNTLNPPEPEPTTDIEETNSTKIWIQNGCENYEKVTIQNSVNFPPRYYRYNRPWIHHHRKVKLFTSESLTYNWNWFKEHKIKGLNVTLAELMTFFDKNGCLFMPFGEGVKNIFLGSIKEISSLSIEGETTCNVLKIYELCREKFNIHVCGVKPTKTHNRVTLGIQDDHERFLQSMIDPIVITSWNTTFNRPKIQWEFTANSVGIYDNTAGKIFVIDMTGRSVKDICDHVIAIPVEPARWKNWTGNNLIKVMRYYNLNSDGFYSKGGIRNFVNREVKRLFDYHKFQEYYCRYVYDGIFVMSTIEFSEYLSSDLKNSTSYAPEIIPECRVVSPDVRSARIIGLVNKTLVEDYGDFWTETMLPAISGLNFLNIEDRVFLEGEPTIASWPKFEDYDIDTTKSTENPSTEEYPGDWKQQDYNNDDFLDNDEEYKSKVPTVDFNLLFFKVLLALIITNIIEVLYF